MSDTASCDPPSGEISDKTLDSEILIAPSHIEDHLCPNALPDNNSGGDLGGDPTPDVCENIQASQISVEVLPDNNPGSFPQGDPGGDPLPLPLIKEKGIYWSSSFQREVTVFLIFDEMSEASCQVSGRGRWSLQFTDLEYCEKSPRHDFSVGDKVVILVGKLNETFATITEIRADGIWLKSDDRKKRLAKAYFPHQLAKA